MASESCYALRTVLRMKKAAGLRRRLLSYGRRTCAYELSAERMSPNNSQVWPLKACNWTDWIG